MLTYQRGAFDGSPAKAATSAGGRSITISVTTSTAIPDFHLLLERAREPAEHGAPPILMRADGGVGELRVDQPQLGRRVAVRRKLDRDQAGLRTREDRGPGEHEAPGW